MIVCCSFDYTYLEAFNLYLEFYTKTAFYTLQLFYLTMLLTKDYHWNYLLDGDVGLY